MAVVKIKGLPVVLGGDTYTVPPITLGALEQLQERIAAFTGDVTDLKQVATVIDAAHSALKRNYPEMTREQIAALIDVGNMADVFEAVMDVSGLKRKGLEAQGEALPGQ
jgi:hypothetical protein